MGFICCFHSPSPHYTMLAWHSHQGIMLTKNQHCLEGKGRIIVKMNTSKGKNRENRKSVSLVSAKIVAEYLNVFLPRLHSRREPHNRTSSHTITKNGTSYTTTPLQNNNTTLLKEGLVFMLKLLIHCATFSNLSRKFLKYCTVQQRLSHNCFLCRKGGF